MSISSKLTDIRTAIANSYGVVNSKGGTLPQKQCLNNLPNAIDSIPTGGTSEPPLLFFYDYDGSLIDSYSASEIQGLSALPTAPDHSTDDVPLTFQEWNWSLAQIKAYNTSCPEGVINVGAIYIPTDNNMHLIFRIGDHDSSGVKFTVSIAGSASVNWGDGNTETISGTTLSHIYASAGEYDCSMSGIKYINFYSAPSDDQKYRTKLIAVRIGLSSGLIVTNAFYNCVSLTTVTIPKNVTSVGANAFYGCRSLVCAVIPNGATDISSTFNNCSSLVQSILPSTITNLGANSYIYCYSLKSITIPNGVTSIGQYCFFNCNYLANALIPSTVTSIGTYAFYNCYPMSNLVIKNGVTSFGDYTFYNAEGIKSITVPSSLTSIGTNTFYGCKSLKNVTIMSGVTTITNNMFRECNSLTNVSISSGVTSIGSASFYNCYPLEELTIPATTTSIGDYAFYNCYSLASLTFSNGIANIGSNAFYGCYTLASVTLPSSVTDIGSNAFAGCYSLDTVIMEGTTPPTLANANAFSTLYQKHIYVPSSAVETYKSAPNWSSFSSIIEANPYE